MKDRKVYCIFLLYVLFATNSFAQKDSAILNASFEYGKADSIFIKVELISKYKSPILINKENPFIDFVCSFGSIHMELEKLEKGSFKKEEFDCDPSPETFNPREKKNLYYNDSVVNKYNITTFFGKSKKGYIGKYRIKVFCDYSHQNNILRVASNWIYFN